tara:strand:+ start:2578 stop:3603 length:1026 start_codon:yes stop_codon:yes gene_type:complete
MTLNNEIDNLIIEFNKNIKSIDSNDIDSLNDLKNKYLSRKGKLSDLFTKLGTVDSSERPIVGKKINDLKQSFSKSIQEIEKSFDSSPNKSSNDLIDLTLPGDSISYGTKHPITKTINEIKSIFSQIGFSVAYGPEIDDDYHNFEALNIPKHHPARDMQDTFYINTNDVLRTHTSNTQIHLMENSEPPIRVICPGRVYRNEAISIRSYCLFHQIEGLYINKNVSFSEMKGTIEYFCKQFFGEDVVARFRPSFFPFTEPSAEVDISCMMCKGKGCSMCKKTGWLEILGCGLVDPEVLKNVGYDPEIWSGYAWGMGIERMAILKYGIDDIRLFFNGNVKFLRQF